MSIERRRSSERFFITRKEQINEGEQENAGEEKQSVKRVQRSDF